MNKIAYSNIFKFGTLSFDFTVHWYVLMFAPMMKPHRSNIALNIMIHTLPD